MIKVRAQSGNKAEILIYEVIGEDWYGNGVTAEGFREELEALGDVTDITVRINSVGGAVFDGFAIYNALKEHPAEIVVHVDGAAFSIASVIAMAGNLVVMGEGAMMMIHDPWSIAIGDAEDFRHAAEVLDKIKKGVIGAYAKRTDLDEDELSTMMEEETWFTAAEAVEQGFADELADPEEEEDVPAAAITGFRWAAVMAKYRRVPKSFKPPWDTAGSTKSASAGATSKEETMKGKEAPASAPGTDQITDEQKAEIKAQALAEDQGRRTKIRSAFGHFADDHEDLLQTCLEDTNCTAAQARKKLLDALADGREPAGKFDAGEDEHDKRVRGIEGGLLARSPQAIAVVRNAATNDPDRSEFKNIDPGGEFRGMTLFDLVRSDLERMQPGSTRRKSRRQIVSAFFAAAGSHQTTSDFAVALENTLHKVLLAAYAIAPDTWRACCAIGEVSDFRAHNRYRTGYIASLDQIQEEGEFTNKTIPDAVKETIQAETYGNIVGLSRKAIINDDMGVFNRIAVQIGRAAGLTIEELFYALLAQNSGLGPTMSDSKSLFHADHNNVGGGQALSAAAIDDDGELLESQTDPSGNEYLSLRPSVLLVPRGLRSTAITINESRFDPDTADSNKPNTVLGLFDQVLATPRLSGTRRYMFADPMITPAIEVAFLNGEQEPYMEMQDGWRSDGAEWKVRHDVGVSGVDYRPAVTDAGV